MKSASILSLFLLGSALAQTEIPGDVSNEPSTPKGDDNEVLIVGGTAVTKGEFPFIASLATTGGTHFCAGTLVGPDTVITAAHCMGRGTNFVVRLGRYNIGGNANAREAGVPSEHHRVEAVRIHPQYNVAQLANDIAVIKLSTKSSITPMKYAQGNLPVGAYAGAGFTIAGWGRTDTQARSTILRKTTVVGQSVATCQAAYGNKIKPGMMCAGRPQGGKDACQGDSGGPIFTNNQMYGIISWGEGCGQAGKFGVYTQVNQYRNWLQTATQSLGCTIGSRPVVPNNNNNGPGTPTNPVTTGNQQCQCMNGAGQGQTCARHTQLANDQYNWCFTSRTDCLGARVGTQSGMSWAYCMGNANNNQQVTTPNKPCQCNGGVARGMSCGTHGVDTQNWCYVRDANCAGVARGTTSAMMWSYSCTASTGVGGGNQGGGNQGGGNQGGGNQGGGNQGGGNQGGGNQGGGNQGGGNQGGGGNVQQDKCRCIGTNGFGNVCGTHNVDTRNWCYVTNLDVCQSVNVGTSGKAWRYCTNNNNIVQSTGLQGTASENDSLAVGESEPVPDSPDAAPVVENEADCTCTEDGSYGSYCANPDNDPNGAWCKVGKGCPASKISGTIPDVSIYGNEEAPFIYGCGGKQPVADLVDDVEDFQAVEGYGELSVLAAGPEDDEDPSLILVEDFTSKGTTLEEDGWQFVDTGSQFGPSKWAKNGPSQAVRQESNIRTPGADNDMAQEGTVLISTKIDKATAGDYAFKAMVTSYDNDQIGVVFRYKDDKNHYRFVMDSQDRSAASTEKMRLIKVENGVYSTLASAAVPYVVAQWYMVEVQANKDQLVVFVDGNKQFVVTDTNTPLITGTVGLYAHANRAAQFTGIRVATIEGQAAVVQTAKFKMQASMMLTAGGNVFEVLEAAADDDDHEVWTNAGQGGAGGVGGFLSSTTGLIAVAAVGVAGVAAGGYTISRRNRNKRSPNPNAHYPQQAMGVVPAPGPYNLQNMPGI